MDAKLVVVGHNAKPSEIKLNLPCVIGRGRRSNLVLPLPVISRRHCEVFEADGYLMVRDLNSMNGTFVNNCRTKEAVLAPGALLTVGTLTFRAVYEVNRDAHGAPPPDSPAAAEPVALTAGPTTDSDSALRHPTIDASEFVANDAEGEDEEVSTEVSDVDPEELPRAIAEARRQSERGEAPDGQ
jgi:pSer/pThr/pTyr-binding forkhead associated (FHA) protein